MIAGTGVHDQLDWPFTITGMRSNAEALVHYAARHRRGETISTAFVESSVNEIIAKRMTKKQQMRWNRTTVQPFLPLCQ